MTFENKYKKLKTFQKKDIDLSDFTCFEKLNLLEKVDDSFYRFRLTLIETELEYLKYKNSLLIEDLSVKDLDLEVKEHIKKLHHYNEVKDCLQNIILRIAELKNTTMQEINKELEIDFDEACNNK